MACGTHDEVTRVVEVPSTKERYLCVHCWWFGQYASNELEAVWNCFIAILDR